MTAIEPTLFDPHAAETVDEAVARTYGTLQAAQRAFDGGRITAEQLAATIRDVDAEIARVTCRPDGEPLTCDEQLEWALHGVDELIAPLGESDDAADLDLKAAWRGFHARALRHLGIDDDDGADDLRRYLAELHDLADRADSIRAAFGTELLPRAHLALVDALVADAAARWPDELGGLA